VGLVEHEDSFYTRKYSRRCFDRLRNYRALVPGWDNHRDIGSAGTWPLTDTALRRPTLGPFEKVPQHADALARQLPDLARAEPLCEQLRLGPLTRSRIRALA